MTRLSTCADVEAVAARAAGEVAGRLQQASAERDVAHIALSGGTSPRSAYELLARQPERWVDVEVWFADERCVPPEDQQSNYRLAAETLLAPARIAPERVHRMEGELGPEVGARRYAQALVGRLAGDRPRAAPHGPPVLDVIVLGIGPEGHVASLFPDASALDADDETVCLGVRDSPKPPPERITLTLPVLRAARHCILLATGASKSGAIAAMLGPPSRHVPASLLNRERLTVIVDDTAAPHDLDR